MKKIVFALYVFGIMIMFPLYVVLELNHKKTQTSEDNLSNDAVGLVERKSLQEFVKVKVQKSQPVDEVLPVFYNTVGYTSYLVSLKSSL